MYESSAGSPGQHAAYKNHHFTTVSDIWPARSDERVAERASKFAFHHSFGRPMSTKRREGCQTTQADSHFTSVLDVRWARNDETVATTRYKIRISPQFWTSDEHEVTRGLRGDLKNSHFTSVLDVRWARSDERVVSRLDRPNPPCVKKERNFKEVLIHNHSQQIFSADFFSRSSQQIFSADLLSRSSQQIFSQQLFSADLLSRFSQQIFSADFLQQIFFSRSSQQIFSADLLSRFSLSRFSQQIFSADFLSRSSQQIFSADLLIVLSFAVVRGWWSAIVLSFLSFAVVRGWWSAIVLSCWWSILHEFFRRTLSRSFREKWNSESFTPNRNTKQKTLKSMPLLAGLSGRITVAWHCWVLLSLIWHRDKIQGSHTYAVTSKCAGTRTCHMPKTNCNICLHHLAACFLHSWLRFKSC